jgi:hypothetical protein
VELNISLGKTHTRYEEEVANVRMCYDQQCDNPPVDDLLPIAGRIAWLHLLTTM